MYDLLEHIPGYRIKTVARITGLSTHAIRKWEERYQWLHPQRGPNTYRIYTEEDVQLLLYVKSQIAQGESIGQLSQAGEQDLKRSMQQASLNLSGIPVDYQKETIHIIEAARAQNIDGIQHQLTSWISRKGLEDALHLILFPLLRLIGELWHQGGISISGEHHVTRLIRQHLISSLRASGFHAGQQALIACVPGEYHEVAPLSTALLLQNRGWQVTYLGPNVSFEVLRMALHRARADLMILSCTTEPEPKLAQRWLQTIAQQLQSHCRVMVGGPGFSGYSDVLARQDIVHLRQINDVLNPDQTYSAPT